MVDGHILDEENWGSLVSPSQLSGVEDGGERDYVRALDTSGGELSYTVFNVLTFAIHSPRGVERHIRDNHPTVYESSPLSNQWLEPYVVCDGEGREWMKYQALLKVSHALFLFMGTIIDRCSEAPHAHYSVLQQNPDTFSCDVKQVDGLTAYRSTGEPVKVVPDSEMQTDVMEW